MARGVSIRESIDAEKELFTNPQYADIQESLARGGRVRGEDIPISLQEAIGVMDNQKLRLTKVGMRNFINDRMESERSPAGWAQNRGVSEDALTSYVNTIQKSSKKKLTPEQISAISQSLGLTETPVATTQEIIAPKGTVVENAGQLDYSGIQGLVNQLNNLLRPVARKAASATPVGAVGTGIADTIQGIKEKQFADNPLARLLSDTSKKVKKAVAGVGQGEDVTLEDKLGSYLEQKFPELAKKAPKDTLRINAPESRGLRRFSGVGEFKSPYGRFILDESGTLRKV